MTQLVVLGKTYLSDSGATRDAAAIMLGQLLTRPDMSSSSQKNYLESFFEWSSEILSRLAKSDLTNEALTEELYLAGFSRFPSEQEKQYAAELMTRSESRQSGIEDLMWAMINSPEFSIQD